MQNFDRAGIAGRLRSLFTGLSATNLSEIATRLGVEEVSLHMSIDELSPHPTVEVMAAVIREYGVDPSWLLTGTYDASTHRTAMEGRETTAAALNDFIFHSHARISDLPAENIYPHEQN